jgi:hypothetical protein
MSFKHLAAATNKIRIYFTIISHFFDKKFCDPLPMYWLAGALSRYWASARRRNPDRSKGASENPATFSISMLFQGILARTSSPKSLLRASARSIGGGAALYGPRKSVHSPLCHSERREGANATEKSEGPDQVALPMSRQVVLLNSAIALTRLDLT